MDKKETFKILIGEVISVSEHKDLPYTIEIKTKALMSEKNDSLTIDPRCSFYKDDRRPKTIDIVRPGDTIEATYIMNESIKVAFNIVVMPEP